MKQFDQYKRKSSNINIKFMKFMENEKRFKKLYDKNFKKFYLSDDLADLHHMLENLPTD